VELEIAQKRGADAQFPSRFEVKMNKREENSIYSVVSLGSRERGGIKACLGHTALEDESAVSCRATFETGPFGRSGGGFR
jgi:hypothetical protein